MAPHIPEDCILHNHLRENLKPHIMIDERYSSNNIISMGTGFENHLHHIFLYVSNNNFCQLKTKHTDLHIFNKHNLCQKLASWQKFHIIPPAIDVLTTVLGHHYNLHMLSFPFYTPSVIHPFLCLRIWLWFL
jgi:hypothetical protein